MPHIYSSRETGRRPGGDDAAAAMLTVSPDVALYVGAAVDMTDEQLSWRDDTLRIGVITAIAGDGT